MPRDDAAFSDPLAGYDRISTPNGTMCHLRAGSSGPFPQFSPLAGEWSANGVRVGNRSGAVLSRGSVAFLHQALQIQPALLSRLHAAGQVRAEVESVIESYVTVVAGRRLPPVDF